MDIKDEEVSYKVLCNACLCVGRTLHKITDVKSQKYYLNILDEIPLYKITSLSLFVCWECKALLEKSVSFKEQVQDCYRILQTYTNENLHECLLTDVTRPPRLKVHITEPVNIIPADEYEDLQEDEVGEFAEVPVVCVKDEVKNEVKDDWSGDKDDDTNLLDEYCSSDNSENTKELESELQNIMCSLQNEKKKTNDKNKLRRTKKSVNNLKVEKCSLRREKKKTNVKNKLRRTEKIVSNLELEKRPKPSKEQDQKILTIELSYEEMLVERERESNRDVYVKSEYKCETCLIGFNYKKSYQAHIASKHSSDLGDYICPICKTIISSVDSFTAHYKRHMRRYECSICQKRTLDMKVMQQHYYSSHEISLKEYKCNLCGKISNSIDIHRYHKDTHKARVQCTECDKTFRHRAGLMNHRLAVHEYRNAFPCTVCDKVFRWKTSLRRHLEKHEVKGKPATAAAYCSMCNVYFSSICSYQRHMKNSLKHVTQDQLKFICDHCNKRFADKTKIRDHIEEKHLHRTYQCHICHKPSKNRVGLDQHIRNVHKGRPNNKMCHHCGKGFPTKVQLESHIRTHTGERPLLCEFCPTTFSQHSNLYKHNRQVHLNIKSKRYPVCKSKDDKPLPDVPTIDNSHQVDPYRVAALHYSPDRGFVL